jgi:hypothetical protein
MDLINHFLADPRFNGIAGICGVIALLLELYRHNNCLAKISIVFILALFYSIISWLLLIPPDEIPFNLPPFLYLGLIMTVLSLFGVVAASEQEFLLRAIFQSTIVETIWALIISISIQLFAWKWDFMFTVQSVLLGIFLGVIGGSVTFGVNWIGSVWQEVKEAI